VTGALAGIGAISERLTRPRTTQEVPVERGVLLSTPGRPDHRYGNLLHLVSGPVDTAGLRDELGRAGRLLAEHGAPGPAGVRWELAIGDGIEAEGPPVATGWRAHLDDVLVLRPGRLRPSARILEIRRVEPAERKVLDELADPEDDFATDGLRDWFLAERIALESPATGFWVAFENDEAVAACFTGTDDRIGRIDQLTVRPAMRRRGWGSAMIAAVCRQLVHCEAIVLEPEVDGWRSHMYRRLGFRREGITVVVLEDDPLHE